LDYKHGDDLQDQGDHYEQEGQDAVRLALEALQSVLGHEEGEPDEYRLRPMLAFGPVVCRRGVLTVPIVNKAFELM
jgi:hypothetical protein